MFSNHNKKRSEIEQRIIVKPGVRNRGALEVRGRAKESSALGDFYDFFNGTKAFQFM